MGFCRQHVLEPIHDDRAPASCKRVFVYDIRSQAVDERVNNVVFDSAGNFPMREGFGFGFREATRLCVESPQFDSVRLRASKNPADARRNKL
jgi:hypothetical protein